MKLLSFGGASLFAEAFNEVTVGNTEVPEGIYTGMITSVKWKVGEYGETVQWEFTILAGECAKRKVWINDKIKLNTLFLLKNHMVQLGYTGSVKDQKDVEQYLNSCIGRTCGLDLTYREYSFTNEAGSKIEGENAQGVFLTEEQAQKKIGQASETDIPF